MNMMPMMFNVNDVVCCCYLGRRLPRFTTSVFEKWEHAIYLIFNVNDVVCCCYLRRRLPRSTTSIFEKWEHAIYTRETDGTARCH